MNSKEKEVVSSLVKAIVYRSLLPQVFYVMLLVILLWAIASLWFYLNYETASVQKLTLISLLTGGIPVITYSIWGIRRFLNKGYIIFHDRVVSLWIQEFSESLANEIVTKNYLIYLEKEQSSILNQLRMQLLKKVALFPAVIQRVFNSILNRIGINDDLDKQIRLVKNGKTGEISELLNRKISKLVLTTNDNLFPGWIKYLIPINTIMYLGLWFA